MAERFFNIGNIKIKVNMPKDIIPPKNFLLFETEDRDFDYEYYIKTGSSVTPPDSDAVAEREDFAVYRKGDLEIRTLGARGRKGYYGLYEEVSPSSANIMLDPSYSDLFSLDTVFSSLFALERRALEQDGLILHSAYIGYDGKAILFSAPSGVGKSTQASLWEKYLGAKTENGDRSLITYTNDRYTASGWPVCGSSEICNNVSYPIAAIVMLSQAAENNIRRLDPIGAFSEIYSQITVNTWNRAATEKAVTLIEKLITAVPVYHLSCNISEEAVLLLRDIIARGF